MLLGGAYGEYPGKQANVCGAYCLYSPWVTAVNGNINFPLSTNAHVEQML